MPPLPHQELLRVVRHMPAQKIPLPPAVTPDTPRTTSYLKRLSNWHNDESTTKGSPRCTQLGSKTPQSQYKWSRSASPSPDRKKAAKPHSDPRTKQTMEMLAEMGQTEMKANKRNGTTKTRMVTQGHPVVAWVDTAQGRFGRHAASAMKRSGARGGLWSPPGHRDHPGWCHLQKWSSTGATGGYKGGGDQRTPSRPLRYWIVPARSSGGLGAAGCFGRGRAQGDQGARGRPRRRRRGAMWGALGKRLA